MLYLYPTLPSNVFAPQPKEEEEKVGEMQKLMASVSILR